MLCSESKILFEQKSLHLSGLGSIVLHVAFEKKFLKKSMLLLNYNLKKKLFNKWVTIVKKIFKKNIISIKILV